MKEKRAKGLPRGLKTASAALLLFLYLAGNVQVESFHSIFHSLEKALHTSEQEKDPCHRAIYHDEVNEGCDHKTHITAVKKCPLCHVVPFNDQQFTVDHSFKTIFSQYDFNDYFLANHIGDSPSHSPARAPPLF